MNDVEYPLVGSSLACAELSETPLQRAKNRQLKSLKKTFHTPYDNIYEAPASPGSSKSDRPSNSAAFSQRRRKLLVASAAFPALTIPPFALGETPPTTRMNAAKLALIKLESAPMPEIKRRLTVSIGGSTGIGISYLPLTIMVENKLLEKHAALLGIDVTAQWVRFPRAAAMYDALLSGALDFAAGGVSQLLTSWDRTRTNLKVKGVGALVSMPIYLVTSNPSVKTVADFTSKDKIALPEVRTSIQAVVLAMAAEKAFGNGKANKLDPLTVALGHPDAMKALLDGATDIDAHFSAAPLMYEELAKPGIHKVLDSYEVLGGPHTYNAVWTSTKFHDENPKIFAAFVGALQEALDQIKANPAAAAAFWLKSENVKNMSVAHIEELIRNPEVEWTMTPKKFMAFATFMNRTGLLSTKPPDWQELFFDYVKNQLGD